ncbi:LIC10235 family protein [Leptospira borgpetersenii]|uniref:Profilin domain protein n=2 Tax=Leptospira borgpetersenii serovar Hardjo-bovis TaxID=338217 RepID=Q04US8_LEPBJ|nr:hypothetical protein [Leptospira borgpetersenii]ABJ75342.1 Hypothetical protein LBJ_0665 [Leptospira borgpetersenii serovar Hardjo-bovis str. JB197]ABJ79797.1 Hypothetical protein LBL_2414 [Leptospira borgpetersenii serovar Hardjo-bovis str. L550]AMX59196.1 hypothetical protein LBK6_12895 [Leptospira borgpetersenii serovar Hardjo]AMX62425.1 hypothetical protein LBK9_12805 [Leptospira borgpetersenii serovar Hardjo]AMX65667.1 hypothetical protein LBK30_12820 [Leptospira borgpetersenii serovar
MKPKKISKDDLESLITGVQSQSIEAVGNYLYKGFRIQISKYNLSGAERVQLLYQKRRNNGLCIVCGTKVSKKNPSSGKPYRLCERHRKSIDQKK